MFVNIHRHCLTTFNNIVSICQHFVSGIFAFWWFKLDGSKVNLSASSADLSVLRRSEETLGRSAFSTVLFQSLSTQDHTRREFAFLDCDCHRSVLAQVFLCDCACHG